MLRGVCGIFLGDLVLNLKNLASHINGNIGCAVYLLRLAYTNSSPLCICFYELSQFDCSAKSQ